MKRMVGVDRRRGFTSSGKEVVLKGLIGLMVCATLLGWVACAEGALIDNGDGLIYDTDLNITWLQETRTTPIYWNQAMQWASFLNRGDVMGWRLPTTPATTDPYDTEHYTKEGEMGHLIIDELKNPLGWPLVNRGPFVNLQQGWYWTSTDYSGYPEVFAWTYAIGKGTQMPYHKGLALCYAMAVHDGNIGRAVPEPAITLLLGLGLVGMLGAKRKIR